MVNYWHGNKGESYKWKEPEKVATSDHSNRADQGNHIKANEYMDRPEVLREKVKVMADMVRAAKVCCAYTGAGLSSASGIPDYATKATNSVAGKGAPKLKSNLDALPTYAHFVLTSMEQSGYLHHYVQQNHDGLPQKSGFPQHKINEIHGAWYDPSNPVVQFSGNLRGDLFKWMTQMEKQIDLCLCLGTSLSGMNADRVAETPARRSLSDNKILGTIIINLQQTRLDDVCALRIWGRLDEVFHLLAQELELQVNTKIPTFIDPNKRVYYVPYAVGGQFLPNAQMTLDLSDNQEVIIPVKGAMNEGVRGIVTGMYDNFSISIRLKEGEHFVNRILGVWWIKEALEGKISQLPITNVNPPVLKSIMFANQHPVVHLPNAPPGANKEYIKIVQSHEHARQSERENDEFNNGHKWGLQIDLNDCDKVDRVVWHLHPTFHPAVVSCTEAPFRISRLGWGTFVVKAEVTLKPEYGARQYQAAHELTFNGGGQNVKSTLVQVS